MGLLGSLISPPQQASPLPQPLSLEQTPHIVRTTDKSNPIDKDTKVVIDFWLTTSAPVDTPYWFVTSWQRENDGRIIVSLAGVRLSSPDEIWHLIDDEENKVMWIGAVEVSGNNVKLISP